MENDMLGLTRLGVIGLIGIVIVSMYGYYTYQINTRNNKINELRTKSLVQDVKINNLNTAAKVQKNINKNKVFEEVQKSKKKEIQDETTVKSTDFNVSIGKHSITL